MSDEEHILWGIHAGRLGDADSLFLKRSLIAIGWDKMGDMTSIASDREALKARIAATYPKAKPGAIPVHAGQIYRFANEMREFRGHIPYPRRTAHSDSSIATGGLNL